MDPETLRYLQMIGILPRLDGGGPTARQRVEAGLRGVAEGATSGFIDELAGGLTALLSPEQRAGLGRLVAPEGQEDRYARAAAETGYTEVRDAARRQQREGMAASPGDAIAGQLAGGVAASRVLPLPPAAGMSERLARAAGGGTLAGLGMSEAEDVQGMAEDAALGGSIGLAAGGAGEVVRGLVGGVDEAVQGRQLARLRQAGVSRVPQRRQVAGRRGVEELYRTADELERAGVFEGGGILPAATDDVQARIGLMGEDAGQALGAVRSQLSDAPVDVSRLRQWMNRQLITTPQNQYTRPIREFWRGAIADLDDMEAMGPVTYGQLDELRQSLGAMTGPAMRGPRDTVVLNAQRALYGQLADTQSQAVREVSQEIGSTYDTARRRYDIARRMGTATSQDAVAEAGAGLTRLEAGMAGLGAAAGGPGGALTSVVGKKIAQSSRLPVATALGREAMARGVEATGGAARQGARLGAGAVATYEAPDQPEYTTPDMVDVTPDDVAEDFYSGGTAPADDLTPDDEVEDFYGD